MANPRGPRGTKRFRNQPILERIPRPNGGLPPELWTQIFKSVLPDAQTIDLREARPVGGLGGGLGNAYALTSFNPSQIRNIRQISSTGLVSTNGYRHLFADPDNIPLVQNEEGSPGIYFDYARDTLYFLNLRSLTAFLGGDNYDLATHDVDGRTMWDQLAGIRRIILAGNDYPNFYEHMTLQNSTNEFGNLAYFQDLEKLVIVRNGKLWNPPQTLDKNDADVQQFVGEVWDDHYETFGTAHKLTERPAPRVIWMTQDELRALIAVPSPRTTRPLQQNYIRVTSPDSRWTRAELRDRADRMGRTMGARLLARRERIARQAAGVAVSPESVQSISPQWASHAPWLQQRPPAPGAAKVGGATTEAATGAETTGAGEDVAMGGESAESADGGEGAQRLGRESRESTLGVIPPYARGG